jgi:hypothetical protein
MTNEFAWAIGIFEGEGTMGTYPWGNGQTIVVMQIMQTDEDVLRRYHEAVGVGKFSGPFEYKNSVKPLFRWRLNRQAEIHNLLTRMLPMLGQRRTEKAREILGWIENRPNFRQSEISLPAWAQKG